MHWEALWKANDQPGDLRLCSQRYLDVKKVKEEGGHVILGRNCNTF